MLTLCLPPVGGRASADGIPFKGDRYDGARTIITFTITQRLEVFVGRVIELTPEQEAALRKVVGFSPRRIAIWSFEEAGQTCTCELFNMGIRISSGQAEIPHAYLQAEIEHEANAKALWLESGCILLAMAAVFLGLCLIFRRWLRSALGMSVGPTFTTKLSVQECAERLGRATKPVSFFSISPPKAETFYLKIRGARFRLHALAPDDWRNSFMPFLFGSMRATSDGTRIDGRIRPHGVILAFLAVWFAGLLGFATFIIVAAVEGWGHFNVHPAIALLPILVMGGFGTGMVVIGRNIGDRQRAALVNFLAATLEAEPQSVPEATHKAKDQEPPK